MPSVHTPSRPGRPRPRARRRCPRRLLVGVATVVTALFAGPTGEPHSVRAGTAGTVRAAGTSDIAGTAGTASTAGPAGTPDTAAVGRWGRWSPRPVPVRDVHVPPVAAPVTDGFRPPTHPYGPGNRGLEYDTRPGTAVQASAAGEVVFAGPVGGTRHVTVRHPGGVRTTYSFLANVAVVVGQGLGRGDVVGRAGERLHFGARDRGGYIDPTLLFATGHVEVALVPVEQAAADLGAGGG